MCVCVMLRSSFLMAQEKKKKKKKKRNQLSFNEADC